MNMVAPPQLAMKVIVDMELRDPNMDNSKPESWAASDESSKSTWKTYTYSGAAANGPYALITANNFSVYAHYPSGLGNYTEVVTPSTTRPFGVPAGGTSM